jgi:hypothetical protein
MMSLGLGSTVSDSRAKKFEMELSRCPTPVIETLNFYERSFFLSNTIYWNQKYDTREEYFHEPSPTSQDCFYGYQLDRSHSTPPLAHHGIRNTFTQDGCPTSRCDQAWLPQG